LSGEYGSRPEQQWYTSSEKNWRRSISKELERAIADLRNDIARSGPGLVKVFRDQLTLVLDALDPAPERAEEAPVDNTIRVGDTVETLTRVDFFGEVFNSGTKGVVMDTNVKFNNFYPYAVKIIGSVAEINFNRKELRKVA
jgi:hypothetical protein